MNVNARDDISRITYCNTYIVHFENIFVNIYRKNIHHVPRIVSYLFKIRTNNNNNNNNDNDEYIRYKY